MEIVGKRLRKYYHLEPKGRDYLETITQDYDRVNEGIKLVLSGAKPKKDEE